MLAYHAALALAAPRRCTVSGTPSNPCGPSMAQAAPANPAPDAGNPQFQVEHDRKRQQFVIRLNGSHDRAVLLYEYVGKKTVDLQHTEVPDAYRGRGIAKHLVKAAMDFVVEEDLKAHLTCTYIQKYVKENPQPQYSEHIYQRPLSQQQRRGERDSHR